MFKKFDGIIVDEVICYEETVKMKLPKDYKEFLLDTNGEIGRASCRERVCKQV